MTAVVPGSGGGRAGEVPPWFDPHDERTARAAWTRLAEPDDAVLGALLGAVGAAHLLLAVWQRPDALVDVLARARSAVRAGADLEGGLGGGLGGDLGGGLGGDLGDDLGGGESGGGDGGDRADERPGVRAAAQRAVAGWRLRAPSLDPLRDLATVQRFGGRFVVPGDAEWPAALGPLGGRAPYGLWVRGPADLAAATRRAVAMVGCRACSGYGELLAGRLAAGCVERGLTVVSGAAYGIDACAHRGALAAGGLTVAVLAGGADRAYPRGNEALIERIAATTCVVAEVAPGSAPTRSRFVARNRLIAALADVTVVVEAGWRSGAAITAREADALGRPFAAVPGPVTSAASAGCHRLLRVGAVCVTDADEIAELADTLTDVRERSTVAGAASTVAGAASTVAGAASTVAGAASTVARGSTGRSGGARSDVADHDGLDEVELRVFDALPVRRPVPVERVAVTAGLDLPTVRAVVGRLELRGLARRTAGAWSRAPRRPSGEPR